jgi:ribonuclease P protein component
VGPESLRSGRVVKTLSFSAKYAPNGLTHPRLGVVVSKKAGKTAVARHLIKRVILEGAAKWAAGKAAGAAGYDILFIASPVLSPLTSKEIRAALKADISILIPKLPT